MTGFLDRIAARSAGTLPLLHPRRPSTFEPDLDSAAAPFAVEEVPSPEPRPSAAIAPAPAVPAPAPQRAPAALGDPAPLPLRTFVAATEVPASPAPLSSPAGPIVQRRTVTEAPLTASAPEPSAPLARAAQREADLPRAEPPPRAARTPARAPVEVAAAHEPRSLPAPVAAPRSEPVAARVWTPRAPRPAPAIPTVSVPREAKREAPTPAAPVQRQAPPRAPAAIEARPRAPRAALAAAQLPAPRPAPVEALPAVRVETREVAAQPEVAAVTPPIEVHIGRVEIVSPEPPAPRASAPGARPGPSLDAFLTGRRA